MNNINQNGNFHTPLSPMRFQSSMGKEVRRRYKDGKNVVRLSLARVVKVNYKYNTVDVVTIQHKNSTVKNPNDNGRYSARLPVQLGGQTPDGKIFGSNTLVTVGALVLVGFLEGSKDTPIVLNIYGDVDNQSMLTRTTFTGANESDESLQQELWQLFTLYPSMTYKNIDGHGNQEVTFPGKTFFYTSADDQKVNDAYFDYDHLPSAYYANGDLIEPTVEDAPNMLYVHQSVFGDHRTTFFVKSDGTVRVGSRHADGEGITFWQLNTDGSFKIQQSNDTVNPEDESTKFASFAIKADGTIHLNSPDHTLEIGPSGLLLDGGPVGVSSGNLIDISKNAIVLSLEDRVSKAELKITPDAITSTVTSSTGWQEVSSNASNAQSTASTAQSTAQKAQNIANSKAQTFLSQPTPPYNKGDVWENNGATYICVFPEPDGASFVSADWVLSGDVTANNTAKDTSSVNGVPSSTLTQQAANGDAANTNLNNLKIGGRNYLKNTFNLSDLTNWNLNVGSAITATLNVVNDSQLGGVIDVSVTANSATGNNWIALVDSGLTLQNDKFVVGSTYTVSFLLKSDLVTAVGFCDTDGTNLVAALSADIPIYNTDWRKIVYTFTATATGNTPGFYLVAHDTADIGHIYVTEVQLEDGQKASGYRPAPEDVDGKINVLENRISTAEQEITPTAITNTVTQSDTYKYDLNSKANSSDLSGYATAGQVDQAQANANAYTDGKIAGVDLSPYVTKSQLTQTSTELTAQFTSSGGVNMLMNSVGYSSTDFWTVSGVVTTTQDPSLDQFGSSSGFALGNASNYGTLTQTVTVTPNVTYTLGVIINKGAAGDAYIQLDDGAGNTAKLDFPDGTAYSWQKPVTVTHADGTTTTAYNPYSINITPTSSSVIVTLHGDAATSPVVFSCVMLNVGSQALQWQQHMGEVYNANITFDINGIRVSHTDSNGKLTASTIMTPEKFAGYSDVNGDGQIDFNTGSVDEIFRMDQDTFVMKTATIGPIKIVPVTTGGYNGLAFIPSS